MSNRTAEKNRARSARKREVRKVTVSFRRSDHRRVAMAVLGLDGNEPRESRHLPLLRSDCPDESEPCPYLTCHHHLFFDVTGPDSIVLNFPDLAPEMLQHSCSLNVADGGPVSLERVGEIMNITRERVRQIEERALGKLRSAKLRGLR